MIVHEISCSLLKVFSSQRTVFNAVVARLAIYIYTVDMASHYAVLINNVGVSLVGSCNCHVKLIMHFVSFLHVHMLMFTLYKLYYCVYSL